MKRYRLLLLLSLALALGGCAHRHSVVVDAAREPTCIRVGLTEGSHCSKCGEVFAEQEEIPLVDHTFVVDEPVEPVCAVPGATVGFHCGVCGQVFVAPEEIPALEHIQVIDEAQEPTCLEPGITQGIHCEVCNQVLTAQKVVPAKGHHPSRVTQEEFPRERFAYLNGIPCQDCGKIFSILPDGAPKNTVTTEFEDGTWLERTEFPAWNLSRECAYTANGKLDTVTISREGEILVGAGIDRFGACKDYFENLRLEDGTQAGAVYDLHGVLTNRMETRLNEQGQQAEFATYAPSGELLQKTVYDYNSQGQPLRLRRFMADGTARFILSPDTDPELEYWDAVSPVLELTVTETGLVLRTETRSVKLGILPKQKPDIALTVTDCLTGEAVQELTAQFGAPLTLEPLLDGYYLVTAQCEGYEDITLGAFRVMAELANQPVMEQELILDRTDAQLEDAVRVRVLDLEGSARENESVTLAVTRNRSGYRSPITLETDETGLLCLSAEGDSPKETVLFHLGEGFLLEYRDENGTYIPFTFGEGDACEIQF